MAIHEHLIGPVSGNPQRDSSACSMLLRSLPWKDVPAGHAQAGRAHGRIEKRALKAATVTAGLAFPHAAQAIQITRRTRRPGSRKWRTETSDAITSLPAALARLAQLAEWIRGAGRGTSRDMSRVR